MLHYINVDVLKTVNFNKDDFVARYDNEDLIIDSSKTIPIEDETLIINNDIVKQQKMKYYLLKINNILYKGGYDINV